MSEQTSSNVPNEHSSDWRPDADHPPDYRIQLPPTAQVHRDRAEAAMSDPTLSVASNEDIKPTFAQSMVPSSYMHSLSTISAGSGNSSSLAAPDVEGPAENGTENLQYFPLQPVMTNFVSPRTGQPPPLDSANNITFSFDISLRPSWYPPLPQYVTAPSSIPRPLEYPFFTHFPMSAPTVFPTLPLDPLSFMGQPTFQLPPTNEEYVLSPGEDKDAIVENGEDKDANAENLDMTVDEYRDVSNGPTFIKQETVVVETPVCQVEKNTDDIPALERLGRIEAACPIPKEIVPIKGILKKTSAPLISREESEVLPGTANNSSNGRRKENIQESQIVTKKPVIQFQEPKEKREDRRSKRKDTPKSSIDIAATTSPAGFEGLIEDENTEDISGEDYGAYETRCICGLTDEKKYDGEDLNMVECSKCNVWQHWDCFLLTTKDVEGEYFCEKCNPRKHLPLTASQARAKMLALTVDPKQKKKSKSNRRPRSTTPERQKKIQIISTGFQQEHGQNVEQSTEPQRKLLKETEEHHERHSIPTHVQDKPQKVVERSRALSELPKSTKPQESVVSQMDQQKKKPELPAKEHSERLKFVAEHKLKIPLGYDEMPKQHKAKKPSVVLTKQKRVSTKQASPPKHISQHHDPLVSKDSGTSIVPSRDTKTQESDSNIGSSSGPQPLERGKENAEMRPEVQSIEKAADIGSGDKSSDSPSNETKPKKKLTIEEYKSMKRPGGEVLSGPTEKRSTFIPSLDQRPPESLAPFYIPGNPPLQPQQSQPEEDSDDSEHKVSLFDRLKTMFGSH